MPEPETLTQVKQKPEVREALAQTGGKPKIKAQTRDKFWFTTHALVLLGCAALWLLLGWKWIPLPQPHLDLLARATRATVFIVIVLAIAKAVSVYAIGRVEDASTTFTLRRILHLVVGIVIVFIGLSIFFANWYTALISVGVVSIIVGLAVQTPMTSFIGWIYILVRRPYRVGDRIKIGDATGDVIDVSYIDTTLWEFGGSFLSTDHPSGRVIKFPNAKVLSSMVYNYSWPLFPYIWNEIKFQIAYQSDLQFVAQTMERIVEHAFACAPSTADYFADVSPDSRFSFRSRRIRREARSEKIDNPGPRRFAETESVGTGSDPGRAAELRRGSQHKAPNLSR